MNIVKSVVLGGILVFFSLACSLANHLANQLTNTSTPTPTLTTTPIFTPTLTITPTPTTSPTPLPATRIEQGDRALFMGDWESALDEFEPALALSDDPEIQSSALVGLGRTHLLAGDYHQAVTTLKRLTSESPETPSLHDAYFYLAQSFSALGQHLDAAQAYQDFLDARPGVIDAYVHERRGDALFAAEDFTGTIAAYQQALSAPRLEKDLNLEIKIARAYAASGDYATAIVGYQDIYRRTSNEFIRAQLNFLSGQAYTALGQMDQAYAAYLDSVENYPRAMDAHQGLIVLVNAGFPVNQLDRGLVNYYARQYGVALAALDRYLQEDPQDPATAYYFKGLTYRNLGQYPEAIEEWDRIIQLFTEHTLYADAWDQKAFTLWFNLGQHTEAFQVYEEFVAAFPQHPRAAEFLMTAGSIAERANRLDKAAELWERLASEYPGSQQAYRALFLGGITRYRLSAFSEASSNFQKSLNLASTSGERAAAYFWSGKSQAALGDDVAARTAWEQSALADPTGYYSERAKDLLSGREPFTLPIDYDLVFDLDAERREAEAWMRTVFSISEETNLSHPGELGNDPRFQRGNEFWRLGLYEEARLEFEDLRLSVREDPTNTYRLAYHLLELGLYRPAIFAARQVLTLAGMDNAATMNAPIYFNHVRFGPYYKELVIPAAQDYNFHPLLIFSLIRQESLFEGFVRSHADARGLMQIIPSTGQEIAARLNWPPGYTSEDLYRPVVSVILGTEYLARQRAYLDGDIYAALAAYNGGPGNASAWKELAPDDPDLFLEVIRFEETRNYIRGIYEVFNIYKRFYDRSP